MTYESRQNGTHAIICDTGVCHGELLAHEQDALFEDANLAGWVEDPGSGKHACPNCTRGVNQMKALAVMLLGDSPSVKAPSDVVAGSPVFDATGRQVATYLADGKAGEDVAIELYMPIKATVPVSDRYAEILGRTPTGSSVAAGGKPDELFDVFGEPEQPVTKAPSPPQVAAPQARQAKPAPAPAKGATGRKGAMSAPAGTSGGAGLVAQPARPDPVAVSKAVLAAPSAPKRVRLIAEMDESVFGFLDGKGGWVPDDK